MINQSYSQADFIWDLTFIIIFSYPMIRYTDMEDNMKKEVMEVCTSACEKHTANNELVRNFFYHHSTVYISCRKKLNFSLEFAERVREDSLYI